MRLAFIALLLSGCASMLQPLPGMIHVASCASGNAYHTKTELICDDPRGFPFIARPLEPNDNANSACVYCENWSKFR